MASRTDSRPRVVDVPDLFEEPGPWRRRIVLAVLLIGTLLALDAIWVVLKVRGQMEVAQSALDRGADALLAGDVDTARESFEEAESASGGTHGFLQHPAAAIAGVTPFVSDDVRAVRRLVDAGTMAADAGTILTGAAQRVGWEGGSLSGLSQGQNSLASTLSDAGAEIRSASEELREAATVLTDTPTVGLIGPVRKAVLAGRTEVVKRADLLESANDLAEVIPALFQDGRRYLLVVQNPNEPRGTGGYMGYMGFLRSDAGNLELNRFFRTPGEIVPQPVEAPADFERRYGRFGALQDLRQANLSPDLPTSAGVTLALARELGWGEFDGIIMVDPVWMQYMLEATGSVGAPGWDEPITAGNVVEVLGKDVFLLESGSASDRVQDQIGTAVWGAVQTTNTSGTAMASALARASSERHLQVYSVHPEEEEILSRLDVTGAAELGRNPLSVVWEATSDNKVGYFIDRRMNVKVKLDEEGTATVKTTLRLRNDAPDGPPSRLLGEGTNVGDWSSLVSVYLPERIAGDPTFTGGLPRSSDTLEEFGHRVAFGEIFTPSGGASTWSVTYEVPDAVTNVDSASEYRLDFLPQPTLSPIELDIQVQLPEGSSVTLTSAGMQTNGRTSIYADSPTTPQSFWVRYV